MDEQKREAQKKFRHGLVFLAIPAIGLALRVFFFSGLVGSDDLSYAEFAVKILKGAYVPEASPLSNRIGQIAMIAVSFAIFGINSVALVLPAFLFSALQILLAYLFFARINQHRRGLFAAGIMAVIPWEVVFATRGYPDVPSSVLFAAFVLLIWPTCERGPTVARGFVAGLMLGLAYLSKEMVLFQMIFWAPCLLFWVVRKKTVSWGAFLAAGAGAVAVFLAESVGYALTTGDFFFRLHAVASGYNETVWSGIGLYSGEMFRRIFVMAPRSLIFDPAFCQVFAAAIIAYIFLRKTDKALWPIFAWLVFDLAFFTVGTTSLSGFNPLPLFRRYMLVMVFPSALLLGAFLDEVICNTAMPSRSRVLGFFAAACCALYFSGILFAPRTGGWVEPALFLVAAILFFINKQKAALTALAVTGVVLVGSCLALVRPVTFETPGNERALFIKVAARSLPLYTDLRTIRLLRFFDGYTENSGFNGANGLFELQDLKPDRLTSVMVAVNETRIAFAAAHYHYRFPQWLAEALQNEMKLMATIGKGVPGQNIYLFGPK